MRNGRATVAAAGLIALVLLAGACSSDSSSGASPATTVATSDASWLFVQTAAGGTWSPGPSGSSATNGTLTLTGVSPQVQAFTDRPDREVSWQSPQQLVDDWASYGFDETPPNASVVVGSSAAGDTPVALELADPTWDAGTATLTYQASIIGGAAQPTALPASFGQVSVFIDSGTDGANLGLVQIWATLATDTDTVTIDLDSGMSIGSFFQWGTITQYCNVEESGEATSACTAAWQVHGSTLYLSGSRSDYVGQVPAPFVTTQQVTFGSVMVPGTALTGTATLSSGASLTLVGPNGTEVPVKGGAFSVDVNPG